MSLLTLKEASEQLNVSKMTICNWVKEKKIDFIVLPNGIRRYKIEEIIGDKKKSPIVVKQESYMPEYQHENKPTISPAKLITLKPGIQTTKSLKTSVVESTIKEKDFSPWWNPWCQEVSRKLWLPTKTDCVDSDLNSLNFSSNGTVQTSWFSITKQVPRKKKWFKISFPFLQSSVVGLMELESIKTKSKKNLKHRKKFKFKRKKKQVNGLHRSYSYRLFPTPEQRQELRKWFGTARFCYNQVISSYNENPKLKLNYTTRDKILSEIPFEHDNVNLEVKKNAIKEAYDTVSAGGDNFQFRSRKNKHESIYVRRSCVSIVKNTIFPSSFGKISSKNEVLPKPELDGSKLVRKGNKYYLQIVKIKTPSHLNFKEGSNQNTICALDPGTYTFQNYYSNLDCGKIAPDAGTQVFSHCKRIDRLISKSSNLKSKLKYRLKRAISREREKLKNKITDLHWKTASFLCNRYDYVFLPHFETQEMVKKHRRKISSKTARNMLTLSHYLFSQRLVSKAQEKGTLIFKLNEPYTSQLCGCCFNLNKGLKLSDRTYKCKHCNTEIDRDYNGARNIFLRGLKLLNEQGLISLRWEVPPF